MKQQRTITFLRLAPLLFLLLVCLTGCGTLTGLPGHGGGKRFAVEQELVAAATRSAIKQIDLSHIRGRKVNLYVNAIGDTGNGNLTGGRFSVVSQLRGDYIQSPATTETSVFPKYTTTTSTNSTSNTSSGSSTNQTTAPVTSTTSSSNSPVTGTSVAGGTAAASSAHGSSSTAANSTSETNSVLNYPESKKTVQEGGGVGAQAGVEYKGLGAYLNSTEITSNDLQYLTALIQTFLFLEGVYIVPPSEAEIDVYVTVDVFGTVRTRIEWFIANNEILKAKTSVEVLAVDHNTGRLVMPPQSAGSEAEYNEQFILWAGPVIIRKSIKKSEPLLCDFTDLPGEKKKSVATNKEEPIPYPFRYEMEQWQKKKEKE